MTVEATTTTTTTTTTTKATPMANERKLDDLSEIKSGDHVVIVFKRTIGAVDADECTAENKPTHVVDDYYYHFIVSQTTSNKHQFEVVYYDNGDIAQYINENLLHDGERSNAGVKTVMIDLSEKQTLDVYKIFYDDQGENKCLIPELTVKKALSYVGEKKYNAFVNNDEHFANYCKTGKAGKLFVLPPEDTKLKEIIGGSVSDKLASSLAQTGTNILLLSTAKHVATKFPRSVAASTLPMLAEAAGSVLCVAIEGVSMSYDIRKKYKEKQKGKMDTIKFKKYIAKRVTRGTFGVAGGIGGGVVGQLVIPVPILGAVIGGLIGGILGSALGHGQGILIGEIVEKVDIKAKEKKAAKQKAVKHYEVLHNLIIPWNIDATSPNKPLFDGDVLTARKELPDEPAEFLLMSFSKADEEKEESELIKSLKETVEKNEFDVYILSAEETKNEAGIDTSDDNDDEEEETANEESEKRLSFLVRSLKE